MRLLGRTGTAREGRDTWREGGAETGRGRDGERQRRGGAGCGMGGKSGLEGYGCEGSKVILNRPNRAATLTSD